MNIRSVTVFCDPGWPLQAAKLDQIGRFITAARPAFEAAGYLVQTTRPGDRAFSTLVEGSGL
jgi:hypothetical protein